jgi:bifunctional lysine-specific demethylase and histidyl-hydroxylase NO66
MDHAALTTAKNNSSSNGHSSHGMSRAAQKKRKKKPRRPEEATSVVTEDSTTRTSQRSNSMISIQHHENSKKRKHIPKEEVEEEDHCDHPNESDDEAIPMKQAGELIVGETMNEDTLTLLPKECHSLYEILFLPPPETKDLTKDTKDELRAALETMTVRKRARCALEFLLQPSGISTATFYKKYHEKLPLHCSCSTRSKAMKSRRYAGIWTLPEIRTVLQSKTLFYGTDVNVTRYEKSTQDGIFRRITLDKKKTVATNEEEGTEYETVQFQNIWKQYEKAGCTLRFLCPQQHSLAIHSLLSLLEWEFGCMVGANVYLTPANGAQGFAPHYDDIDAYIVQLQGRKRWKVYAPLQPQERLPRVSSKDYTSADLRHVEPVLDVILEAGDLLYMPRGWIHQACTIPRDSGNHDNDDMFSLHLTISTMQQWAWADYMEILLPEALQAAIEAPSTLLREALPPRFLDYMGAMHDNREELLPDALKRKEEEEDQITSEKNPSNAELCVDFEMDLAAKRILQEEFRALAKKRIMRVAKEAMNMIDAACDQMGKRFLSDRLPPALTESERSTTNGQSRTGKLEPTMLCRLVRPGIARLVLEDGMAVVYHCHDNSVVYHEHAISPMEFEMDDAPALEQLLTTTPPHWISISDLIHDTIDDKVSIAQALFDEGILATRPETS